MPSKDFSALCVILCFQIGRLSSRNIDPKAEAAQSAQEIRESFEKERKFISQLSRFVLNGTTALLLQASKIKNSDISSAVVADMPPLQAAAEPWHFCKNRHKSQTV